MSKWTLRGSTSRFEYRGQRQDHPAALRAQRYVRRHAWQFHGAGVEDAVRDLTFTERFVWASQNAREGVASVLAALQIHAEVTFENGEDQ